MTNGEFFVHQGRGTVEDLDTWHYDRELGQYTYDKSESPYVFTGSTFDKLQKSEWPGYGANAIANRTRVERNGINCTVIFGNNTTLQWSLLFGRTLRSQEIATGSNKFTDWEQSYKWSNITAEKVRAYRNWPTLSGMNYVAHQRGLWNPEHNDEILRALEIDKNPEIAEWLTKTYCEKFPDYENHFKNSRFHTPPMAALALKFPAYAMMVRAGWSPTIPHSPNMGFYKTVMGQPNPKRLVKYLYGSYSKAFIKHLNANMHSPNNWFLLWTARIGREFFPGEWIKDAIQMNEGDRQLTQIPICISDWKIGDFKRTFDGVPPKRLIGFFAQAAESTENLELFWDTLNMARHLGNAGRRWVNGRYVNVEEAITQPWSHFGTRYLDELHTRVTESFNELRAPYMAYGGSTAKYTSDTKLKFDERLKEIQDATIDLGITIRVAEEAGEVMEWGRTQEHCIASYIPQAAKGTTSLIGFYKDAKLIANASVSGSRITQLRGHRNALVPTEYDRAIRTVVERVIA